jgi:steroid delta-isomerase
MPDREAMVAAIETHCRAISAGDREGWLQIFADDVVFEDPANIDIYHGIDEVGTAFWNEILAISPLRVWLEEEVIICGHEAIAILASDVTLNGAPHRTAPIVDLFTFNEDGKVRSMRAFWKADSWQSTRRMSS